MSAKLDNGTTTFNILLNRREKFKIPQIEDRDRSLTSRFPQTEKPAKFTTCK